MGCDISRGCSRLSSRSPDFLTVLTIQTVFAFSNAGRRPLLLSDLLSLFTQLPSSCSEGFGILVSLLFRFYTSMLVVTAVSAFPY